MYFIIYVVGVLCIESIDLMKHCYNSETRQYNVMVLIGFISMEIVPDGNGISAFYNRKL